MSKGFEEEPKNTKFKGDEPRCNSGHANCKPETCPGSGDNGAPTKWKPEYNQQIVAFFDIEPTEDVKVTIIRKDGSEEERIEQRPRVFPTIEKFACIIDVDTDTLVEWAKPENKESYPGFSVAYRKAKQAQKNVLMTNGLMGHYPSKFAIFVATNVTDMKEKTEVDTNVKGSISLTDLFNKSANEAE